MGAVLIGGNLEGGGSFTGFSDGSDLPPSYIQGTLNAPMGKYGSRADSTNVQPLYVSSAKQVVYEDNWGTISYRVNDVIVSTGNYETVKSVYE